MKKKTWFVSIYEGEFEIHVHRSGSDLMRFIERHDPTLAGAVELDSRDRVRCQKYFKDPEIATVGISWNKYAKALGLEPRK